MRRKSIVKILSKLSETIDREVQVFYHSYTSFTSRFFENSINQNTYEKNSYLTFKLGKGVYSTVNINPEGGIISKVKRMIKNIPAGEFPYKLPFRKTNLENLIKKEEKLQRNKIIDANPIIYALMHEPEILFFEHTNFIREALKEIYWNDFEGFGIVSTGITELGVMNSRGLIDYHVLGDMLIRITIKNQQGQTTYMNFTIPVNPDMFMSFNYPFDKAMEELLFRIDILKNMSEEPVDIEPGKYTVFLEPQAVSDLISFVSYLGFNGKRYEEGRSCLRGKLGKKIFSRELNIVDDPIGEFNFVYPFDMDGVKKKIIKLIEEGVPLDVVYDMETAKKYNRKSTGHSLWRGEPVPFSMVIFPTKGSDAKTMLHSIDRGLWISRFHYVNVAEPTRCVLTGMTRDGLYLIEDGSITYPVKNLRFTMSMLDAFANIESISNEGKMVSTGDMYGARFPTAIHAPYMVIKDFNFSSKSEF